MQSKHSGFTLIELLIVVAIIAILAAIAVPNFLEAQTRAKVTRVKSDMRTAATALESYCVDNNGYPDELPLSNNGFLSTISFQKLTTPIAYLSSVAPVTDVFVRQITAPIPGFENGQPMLYANYQQFGTNRTLGPLQFRAWALNSFGPDRVIGNGQPNDTGLFGPYGETNDPNNFANGTGFATRQGMVNGIYDPTNGTVSFGDLFRGGGQFPPTCSGLMNR